MKDILTNNTVMTVAGVFVVLVLLWILGNTYARATSPVTTERALAPGIKTAYFAGGCFWCTESDFEKLSGVVGVISGYMGGERENPSYANHSDHRETVEVQYDPNLVSYEDLVQYFFRYHDPTDPGGSFYDRGHSYTSAIYPQNDQEEKVAWRVIQELADKEVFPKSIVTAVEPGGTFWIAEDYHQDYYKKNPIRYNAYRKASGRDAYIKSIWTDRDDFEITESVVEENAWSGYEKPSDEELKKTLTPLEYQVTQHEATEAPRTPGNLDDEKRAGIFVDLLSGEPLFSSKDKYDSRTGWPSFTKPIDKTFIVTKTDRKLLFPRVEVRSRYGDNHLGHVFHDGPRFNEDGSPSTGERWCMNGASLTFIPLEEMEEKGYADYIKFVN